MATLWYVGVLGRKSGPFWLYRIMWWLITHGLAVGDPQFGGDIGFELSMSFTALSYPILRALERKWEGAGRWGTLE